jgi:hypothetical protein
MLPCGSQTDTTAPVGSWITAMRPASITSKASPIGVPPRSAAFAAAASALSTVT